MKKYKGSPWHPEPFLDHMDNFLTSDTLENQSYNIMYVDYGFINDYKLIFTKETSQFSCYPERVFWIPLFNEKMITS